MRVDVVADAQTLVDAVCAECKVPTQGVLEYWDEDFKEWALAADSFKVMPRRCKLRLVPAPCLVDATAVGGGASVRVDQTLVPAICAECKVPYTPNTVAEYWHSDINAFVQSFDRVPRTSKVRLLVRGAVPPPVDHPSPMASNEPQIPPEPQPAPDSREIDEQTTTASLTHHDEQISHEPPSAQDSPPIPAPDLLPIGEEADEQTTTASLPHAQQPIPDNWTNVLHKTNLRLEGEGNIGKFELFRVRDGEGSTCRSGCRYLKVRCLACGAEIQTGGGGDSVKPSLNNATQHAGRCHGKRGRNKRRRPN